MMSQGWDRRETRRAVQFRKRSRTVVTKLQESYLRDDIPCGFENCQVCPRTTPSLSAEAPYVIIPDAATLRECLDLFELPELNDNVILLTSVAQQLAADHNIRRSARLRALYTDRRRRCVLFDNLHFAQTAPRSIAEVRSGSDLFSAADWFASHLPSTAGTTPTILIISDNLAATLGCDSLPPSSFVPGSPELQPGVHVLSQRQYFLGRWCAVHALSDVFESMEASKAEAKTGNVSSGTRHWSEAAVAAGLADGTLLRCSLAVNPRDPSIAVAKTTAGQSSMNIRIQGKAAMNRALHGDIVAVRLLTKDEQQRGSSGGGGGGEGVVDAEQMEEGEEVGQTTESEAATDMDSSFLSGAADDVAEAAVTGEEEESVDRSGDLNEGAVGEVVAVLQRSSQEIVACITEADEKALQNLAGRDAAVGFTLSVLCIPADRRFPRLRLRSRQLPQLIGKRVVVRVDGWEAGSNYPHAHVLRVLGPLGDLTSETDGVLVESGVRWQPFGEPALRELPLQNGPDGKWVLSPELAAAELADGRRDLRGEEYFIVSIDPPGCTDVDDAMHVRFLPPGPNGQSFLEVGVHIADVSHFVQEGSALDAEAAARCTTVYLVDRRLDMLPAAISEDAASLREGRDRFAMSVLWTLRAEPPYEVQSTWFGRTLIRSRHQLEYAQAQNILDGNPIENQDHALPPASVQRLLPALRALTSLADSLRQTRMNNGAVELESAELRFETSNSTGQPTNVTVKSEIQMMRTVAEMMIFANAAVATRIYQAFPRAALLRRHAPPRIQGLEELRELCAAVGAPLDINFDLLNASGGNGSEGLGAALRAACAAASPAMATLFRATATRAMSEAQYFCTGEASGNATAPVVIGHFGLALPYYTHFTSPIRRYADVVVHRQLIAALQLHNNYENSDLAVPPIIAPVPKEVAERTEVMNERHRAAKKAQKNCADLFLLLLLHSKPCVEKAVVLSVKAPAALSLFIPKYHTKAVIHLVDKQGNVHLPLRHQNSHQDTLGSTPNLSVVHNDDTLSIVDLSSGVKVSEFQSMGSVWVEMGAEVSRARWPRMKLQLLSEEHPLVQKKRSEEVSIVTGSMQHRQQRQQPSTVQKLMQKRAGAAYRPLDIFKQQRAGDGAAAAEVGSRGPPPGFGAAAVEDLGQSLAGLKLKEGAVASNGTGSGGSKLQNERGITIVETPLEQSICAAIAQGNDPELQVMYTAWQLLRKKAARYCEKAQEGLDPRSRQALKWAAKAAQCRIESSALREYLQWKVLG